MMKTKGPKQHRQNQFVFYYHKKTSTYCYTITTIDGCYAGLFKSVVQICFQ